MRNIIIAVAALAVAAVGTVVIVNQSEDLSKSEAHASKVEAELANVEEELDEASEDLADAQHDVTENEARLIACSSVVELSDQQVEQAMALLEAVSALSNLDTATGLDEMNKVEKITAVMQRIVDESGNETFADMWAECAPEYEPV